MRIYAVKLIYYPSLTQQVLLKGEEEGTGLS